MNNIKFEHLHECSYILQCMMMTKQNCGVFYCLPFYCSQKMKPCFFLAVGKISFFFFFFEHKFSSFRLAWYLFLILSLKLFLLIKLQISSAYCFIVARRCSHQRCSPKLFFFFFDKTYIQLENVTIHFLVVTKLFLILSPKLLHSAETLFRS